MAEKRHPELTNFERDIGKRDVSRSRAAGFDRWRRKLEGELREEADKLWQQYQEEMGGRPATKAIAAPEQHSSGGKRKGPPKSGNVGAAEPKILGEPFHNPYTFLPFPSMVPKRHVPTPLTIDETELDRFTGTVELEIETLSPLLTCSPSAEELATGHKVHEALAIGPDVIVPATGVRGALRSLMTIVTGGTLGFIDDEAWLCQGRDVTLGPEAPRTKGKVPAHSHLARVEHPGDRSHSGRLRLGTTRLVLAETLEKASEVGRCGRLDDWRPTQRRALRELWVDEGCVSTSRRKDDQHEWQVKLSGRPIKRSRKKEGIFLAGEQTLDLLPGFWSAYAGRNRHGEHSELQIGDLVWLEPTREAWNARELLSPEQIKSIQWARWGRQGERLLDAIMQHHSFLLPDAFNPDGEVDEVTDLFGQVPRPDIVKELLETWALTESAGGPAGPFAARVRPENLVFFDAAEGCIEKGVALAPLQRPHPGCVAFYREWSGAEGALDEMRNSGKLRGYKVYRTTREAGELAPSRYSTQGEYERDGRLKQDAKRKINKTCDLLKPGTKGRLRIACRGLNNRELALLLAACSADWRLGGGKPLGLGLCRASSVKVFDECGEPLHVLPEAPDRFPSLPDELAGELTQEDLARLRIWQASQAPVERLRYPRAVNENGNQKTRGGHVWFARHAAPRKGDRDGLETLWTAGELARTAGSDQIRAQALPVFDETEPTGDTLFGYDLFSGDSVEFRVKMPGGQTLVKKLEPFDEERHARKSDKSGGRQSPGKEDRAARRRERKL